MDVPVRKTLRLRGYDYTQPEGYFVTMCVRDRLCLFGRIVNTEMRLNAAGEMIAHWWSEIPKRFTNTALDESVVMPNHFHGILALTRKVEGVTLSRVMNWFKSATTHAYMTGVKDHNWPRFNGRLWQRGFYDRIIRDEREWDAIAEYIADNPADWFYDRNNPDWIRDGRPQRAAPTTLKLDV